LPEHEAEHSPASHADIKHQWSSTSTPPYASWHAQWQLYISRNETHKGVW